MMLSVLRRAGEVKWKNYHENSRHFFLDSQNRIRSMALIHQKLYQSESLAFIDLREYIEDLAIYLFSTTVHDHDLIHLNVDMGDISLSMDNRSRVGSSLTN